MEPKEKRARYAEALFNNLIRLGTAGREVQCYICERTISVFTNVYKYSAPPHEDTILICPDCARDLLQAIATEALAHISGMPPSSAAEPRFPLGKVTITPGALSAMIEADEFSSHYFARHQAGDWGTVCVEDTQENEFSLKYNFRLLSTHTLSTGVEIWIITEWDRSLTTLLLASEY